MLKEIKTTGGHDKTMSSREISLLTKKDHSNVKRDIAAMILKLNYPDIKLKDCPVFNPSELKGHGITVSSFVYMNNTYDEFLLDFDYTLLLVSGYDVTLRKSIINRWQELESKAPALPQTFSEALQLAADQARVIEEQAPKVEVYEKLADRKESVSTTVLAKQLGVSALKLNTWLKVHGYKFNNSKDLPTSKKMEWFNVVSGINDHSGKEFTQCLITPFGQIEIAKRFKK